MSFGFNMQFIFFTVNAFTFIQSVMAGLGLERVSFPCHYPSCTINTNTKTVKNSAFHLDKMKESEVSV